MHMCVYICNVYVCVYVYVCKYVRMYVCTYVHVYVCMYVCIRAGTKPLNVSIRRLSKLQRVKLSFEAS